MPNRKSTRLQDYDYSNNGYYFITICTQNKQHIFGCVSDCSINLNILGRIAAEEIENIICHYQTVEILKYVVMPNHIHAIIAINDTERSRPTSTTIPMIIGLYKSGVSKRIHTHEPDIVVWQRSFYDHIIRNEDEYLRVWQYIDENPLKWEIDPYFTNL